MCTGTLGDRPARPGIGGPGGPVSPALCSETERAGARAPRDPAVDRRARPAPIDDPARAFDLVFGDGTPMTDPAAERRAAQRRFVVERQLARYERLAGSLSAADRARLEQHVEQLRALEQRLRETTAPTCEAPARTAEGTFRETIARQTALAVSAMQCDLSRVVLLQWSEGQSSERFDDVGVTDYHHGISHHSGDAGKIAQQRTIDRWYGDRFAELLDALAAAPAENGDSLLDHTIVLFVNEQSDGNRHSKDDMPYLLAAGARTGFRTDRHLQYDNRSHAELFVALAQALGVTGMTELGHPDAFDSPLTGLV